jgi:ribonuclease HI
LAGKLTEAQAQQALNQMLQQISQTTNSYALQALAQALQALPAKLTEAQAQQALNQVLQQISHPTNLFGLRTLDPSKSYNSDALRALAEALQAISAKLTEAQAQQALNQVLQQFKGGPTHQVRRRKSEIRA